MTSRDTVQIEKKLRRKLLELAQDREAVQVLAAEMEPDPMDQASAAAESVLAVHNLNEECATQHAVAEALERLRRGEYGFCAGCGGPIGARRLRAVPWARLCLACQEEAETGEGLGGLPRAA